MLKNEEYINCIALQNTPAPLHVHINVIFISPQFLSHACVFYSLSPFNVSFLNPPIFLTGPSIPYFEFQSVKELLKPQPLFKLNCI